MAEADLIVECPACHDRAKVRTDKRGKPFLHCSCGILRFQSRRGQEVLGKLLADAGAGLPPAPAPAPAIQPEQPEQPAPVEDRRDFGPVALVVGVALGGLTWWLKQRKA